MQHSTKYDWTHVGAKSQTGTGQQVLAALQSVKHDWSRNPKCLNLFRFFLFLYFLFVFLLQSVQIQDLPDQLNSAILDIATKRQYFTQQ